jgi:hypothetical protein
LTRGTVCPVVVVTTAFTEAPRKRDLNSVLMTSGGASGKSPRKERHNWEIVPTTLTGSTSSKRTGDDETFTGVGLITVTVVSTPQSKRDSSSNKRSQPLTVRVKSRTVARRVKGN